MSSQISIWSRTYIAKIGLFCRFNLCQFILNIISNIWIIFIIIYHFSFILFIWLHFMPRNIVLMKLERFIKIHFSFNASFVDKKCFFFLMLLSYMSTPVNTFISAKFAYYSKIITSIKCTLWFFLLWALNFVGRLILSIYSFLIKA